MLTQPEVESLVADVLELEEFKLTPPSAALVSDTLEQGYNLLMEKAPADLKPVIWALGFLSCYGSAKLEGMDDKDELGRYASDCVILILNRVMG